MKQGGRVSEYSHLTRLLLRSNGLLERAEAALQGTLKANPDDVEAWRRLGDVQRGKGKLSHALECYRRVASLRPQRGDSSIAPKRVVQPPLASQHVAQPKQRRGIVGMGADDTPQRGLGAFKQAIGTRQDAGEIPVVQQLPTLVHAASRLAIRKAENLAQAWTGRAKRLVRRSFH